ncbi:MAG TPA: riboflavin synthase [Terrimicrobiaceae bacterium]|nr:riboflavin synthase [Terrimicrobiaceae bacterium]
MFTGLVEEVGECLWIRQTSKATQLTLAADRISRNIRTGDSVAINGCCLTVTSHRKEQLTFDLLEETLARTNLGRLRPGAKVNLERALAADGRLGGHFVQGHIDCPSRVLALKDRGADLKLEVDLPAEFARYVAWKGSICINGTSLTVAELTEESLGVWIIPHTRNATNLGRLETGDHVNLEFDILAKYAERILARTERPPSPSQS